MIELITASGRGGAVVIGSELLAVYSGNSGKARATAFFSALNEGNTQETRSLADLSGISHREISRALNLRSMWRS